MLGLAGIKVLQTAIFFLGGRGKNKLFPLPPKKKIFPFGNFLSLKTDALSSPVLFQECGFDKIIPELIPVGYYNPDI